MHQKEPEQIRLSLRISSSSGFLRALKNFIKNYSPHKLLPIIEIETPSYQDIYKILSVKEMLQILKQFCNYDIYQSTIAFTTVMRCSRLQGLRQISLRHCDIHNCEFLRYIDQEKLKVLKLNSNRITNLQSLNAAHFPSLNMLQLGFNEMESLSLNRVDFPYQMNKFAPENKKVAKSQIHDLTFLAKIKCIKIQELMIKVEGKKLNQSKLIEKIKEKMQRQSIWNGIKSF